MPNIRTRAEQETIIRRAADQQTWEVFSEDPRVVRRLLALWGAGRPKGEGAVWIVPSKGILFRRPRVLSTEQKAKVRIWLTKGRAADDA